jgi:hypothetical protein
MMTRSTRKSKNPSIILQYYNVTVILLPLPRPLPPTNPSNPIPAHSSPPIMRVPGTSDEQRRHVEGMKKRTVIE